MASARILSALVLLVAAAPAAFAQSSAPVGVRAAGMGGAFTAVADDATATFWNPAGLASGTLAGVTLDGNALDRQSGFFGGLATPPLGLSYYRTSSTAPTGTDRNGPVVTSAIDHVGVTLVQ